METKTYTITVTEKPPLVSYAHDWERGLDPWHEDAFPPEFGHAGTRGPRKTGWYALDWCGNVVGFVADGDTVEIRG